MKSLGKAAELRDSVIIVSKSTYTVTLRKDTSRIKHLKAGEICFEKD